MGALERNPGKADNWIEKVGGLDPYLEKIAKSIHERTGKTISQSIQIAWGMVRKWAAGGDDVNPDTRAKAAKAAANMETKRARYRSMRAVDMAADAELAEMLDLATVDVETMLDLAYGDHKPPYDWKHGYKPISPQAMRIKAKKEKSPNGGKRRRVAGEAPAKGRTAAQAKAADDAQRGRGVPGADTGDAPKRKSIIGDQPSTPPTKQFESAADRTARDKAAADLARRGRERRGEEKPKGTPSTPSKTPTIAAVSSTDAIPNATGSLVRKNLPGGGSYPTKADGSPDYDAMSSEQAATVRAKEAGLGVGARVQTDGGPGVVKSVSSRGTMVELDAVRPGREPDVVRIGAGTPGAGRMRPLDTPAPPKRKSTLREDLGGDSSRLDPPKVRAAAAKRKAALEGKTGDQLKRAAAQHRAAGRLDQAAEADAELARRRAAGQVPSNTPEYREQRAERMATTADPRSPETQASDRERMVRAMSDAELTKELNKRTIKPENKRAVQMELRRRNDAAAEQARENGRKRVAAQQKAREAQAKNDAARAARPPETRDAAMRRQSAEQDASQRSDRTAAEREAAYVEARRESRREGATMAERSAAQDKAAKIAKQAERAGTPLDEIALDEKARRDNQAAVAAGRSAGSSESGQTTTDPATSAGRMTDIQLERTLDRLAEAGDFSSPLFKAVEAEQAKREDARNARRAEGNRPRR